jgi:hypothetical protein
MKNFLTVLLGIICVTVLVLGHSYWNNKIEASVKKTTYPSNNQKATTKVLDQKASTKSIDQDLIALTSNWPQATVIRFKQAMEGKKAFKILFVGSSAIGSDTEGTYPTVKEKLINTYGKKNIQVGLKTFDETSTQFVNNGTQEKIAAEKADLIVLEPFILLDNGAVTIEDSIQNLTTLMASIMVKNPETTFILQPSYPLYNAKIYPQQVEELKNYAKKNQITYLDHWSKWPDYNTEAFKDYLLPDQSAPNDKGSKVWSDYLIHFFINGSN